MWIFGAPASTLATNRVPTHTPGERGGEPASVGDTARCDDDDRLACERAFGVLAEVDDGRNEDREGCLARVAAALSALSADDVNSWVESQFM